MKTLRAVQQRAECVARTEYVIFLQHAYKKIRAVYDPRSSPCLELVGRTQRPSDEQSSERANDLPNRMDV